MFCWWGGAHLSFPPLNAVNSTSSAVPSCVCPFEEKFPSHRRFLKDRDVILDSQGRLGMPGLSIFQHLSALLSNRSSTNTVLLPQVLQASPSFESPVLKMHFLSTTNISGDQQWVHPSGEGLHLPLCFQHKGREATSATPQQAGGSRKSSLFPEQFVQPEEKAPFETCQAFQENLSHAKQSFWRHRRKACKLEQSLILPDSRGFSHLPLL